MKIFGSRFAKQNGFSFSLAVNTERKPRNKTVERITIDPHLSHAQSHLNGRLFLPEEPAQTFKSTANARFSPPSLSLSFFSSSKLQRYHLIPDELTPGRCRGGTGEVPAPVAPSLSASTPPIFLFCGSANPGTKCVRPTS